MGRAPIAWRGECWLYIWEILESDAKIRDVRRITRYQIYQYECQQNISVLKWIINSTKIGLNRTIILIHSHCFHTSFLKNVCNHQASKSRAECLFSYKNGWRRNLRESWRCNHRKYGFHARSWNLPGQFLAISSCKSSFKASSNELRASVAGTVERINKLITVRPAKMRYNGEVGDIVVGRIIEVQQKLWKVDCGTRLNAFLNLAAVNLPGGELRRRGADDELVMRKFLQEGDLILGKQILFMLDRSLELSSSSGSK